MLVYIGVDLIILLFGALFLNTKIKAGNREINASSCFFVLSAVLLIFIMAFRGDFSADYNSYVDIYDRLGDYLIKSIIERDVRGDIEKGYLIFQHIIKVLFDNPIYVFVFSAVIIVLSNLWHFKRYSTEALLSVMLFLEAGIYYDSFNIMRQCIAASIIVWGSKYLYERKMLHYMLVVLIASSFHLTALIMVPFYFISTIKIEKKNLYLYIFLIAAMVGLSSVFMGFIQNYYYEWYSVKERGGFGWKSFVMPTVITVSSIVAYAFSRKSDDQSTKTIIVQNAKNIITGKFEFLSVNIENIWLNSTVLYFFFNLLGFLWFDLSSRFATFFSTYALCFFACQITKSKYRKLWVILTIVILIIYGYMAKDKIPYYFIWDS